MARMPTSDNPATCSARSLRPGAVDLGQTGLYIFRGGRVQFVAALLWLVLVVVGGM